MEQRQPRALGQVIEQMKVHIPKTETALLSELDRVLKSIFYTAPESMKDRWIDAQHVLEVNIGHPTEEWHDTIGMIWADL